MELIQNNIHDQIKLFDDNTFDMIYTNPPYGTTENKWDKPLNWKILFPEMWRVLKPNGVIVLHCSMPFTYELIQCEKPKYHYIWIKNNSTNFFKAKQQPLRKQEEILVYYKKQPTYNPQMVGDKVYKTDTAGKSKYFGSRGEAKKPTGIHTGKYPTNVLNYDIHVRGFSTRPDAMVDFFIKTYTNENDKILDLTCYNALTGFRCKELKRNYVGVDLNRHEDWELEINPVSIV